MKAIELARAFGGEDPSPSDLALVLIFNHLELERRIHALDGWVVDTTHILNEKLHDRT